MRSIRNFLRSNFMLYYYDKHELVYKRVKRRYMILFCLLFIAIFSIYTPLIIKKTVVEDFYEPQTIVVRPDTTYNFTEEKLIQLIKDLNIKFPHIVLAQSKLETGDFTSKIFVENHNLFGMREARVRINIARGTQYNHAYYNNWYESVYDYAFYQSRYLSKLNTEEEYFQYLGESYAEAPNYVEALKGMIRRENLREIFENE
jgi:hypothetical protein